jgi:polyhydroxybutyrate depolymerase
MKQIRSIFLPTLLLAATLSSRAAEGPSRREWKVDGVVREALVYAPTSAASGSTPIAFAFHGHGGSMNNATRMFSFHTHWPEAIVVYMQGLNTPGRLTDPKGEKPGWQRTVGDQDDRDLKFFDAVLASLKQDYRVDAKRIYATGHSNGGGFTYLLLAARGSTFAAFAPSAAAYFPAAS